MAPLAPPFPGPPPSKPAYPCRCPPSTPPGTVLLFYRYYAAPPSIHSPPSPPSLQTFHSQLATRLSLTGKLRLSTEGFNITIAGPTPSINTYITALLLHPSLTGLPLSTPAQQMAFFKPTPGCSCVFPDLSIRICEEITPMAVTDYTPKDWDVVTEVEPREWHELLTSSPSNQESELTLLDVRNHYESSLGYFVSASSAANTTIRPPIRRFSQFPLYIRKRGLEGLGMAPAPSSAVKNTRADDSPPPCPRKILSYCTGGIRCEKASRFLAESLPPSPSQPIEILTLRGGITSYLLWLDSQIQLGSLTAQDSVFKGRNYVFDGRGSVGLANGGEEIVGVCVKCGVKGEGVRKCRSPGCGLEVGVCGECEEVVCCEDCGEMDLKKWVEEGGKRPMCQCEKDREAMLWGGDKDAQIGKAQRTQGWKTKRRKDLVQGSSEKKEKVEIRVKLIPPEEA
jgi:predicted sulfurtransferase